jgi:hypothetical protein
MYAEVLIANGKFDSAAVILSGALRLCACLNEEPTTLSAMLQVLGFQLVSGSIWSGSRHWDVHALEDLQDSCDRIDFIATYAASCEGERKFYNAAFQKLVADGVSGDWVLRRDPKLAQPLWQLYPRGWLYRAQVMANQFQDERQGYILPAEGMIRPEIASVFQRKTIPVLDDYWSLLVMNSADFASWFSESEARLREVRFACAAERYHRMSGEYPLTIDALVEAGSTRIAPRNPDNGSLMEYSRQDADSYKLISRIQSVHYGQNHTPEKETIVKLWAPPNLD